MLLVYLLLMVVGAVATYRAVAWHDRKRTIAGAVGILLSILAILTGFSIGPLVAGVGAVVIIYAMSGESQPKDTTKA